MRRWHKMSSRSVADHRIFTLLTEHYESPRTGAPIDAIVVNSHDWVNIVAITPEQEVVMIRQFRFGNERETLEIPGGIVDAGEAPEAAARRELREETGYEGETWTALGSTSPNPAFMRNRLHSFLAEGCRRAGEQEQDPGEDIAVSLRPLAEVDGMLARQELDHALVAVAFQRLALLRAGHDVSR